MSDEELSVIHSKTCAIFPELYDPKGQPAELNDAFTEEYFNLVKTGLGLGGEVEFLGPHTTDARLSGPGKGLVDVRVHSKNEKFLVSNLAAVQTIPGTSQRMDVMNCTDEMRDAKFGVTCWKPAFPLLRP